MFLKQQEKTYMFIQEQIVLRAFKHRFRFAIWFWAHVRRGVVGVLEQPRRESSVFDYCWP